MLNFTKGNMFDVDADILINTVNCVGVMGCGVALAFKNRYPDMFNEYKQMCRSEHMHPGTLWVYRDVINEKLIVNFPTKNHWKQPSKYSYVEQGLIELRSLLDRMPIGTIVALPALGCGHGGLDWDVVSEMIREQLGNLENITIHVFQPHDSRQVGDT